MLSGKQIAVYSGRSKILRLLFIVDKCDCNEAMQLEALRMAYDKIKKGSDTNLHCKVCSKTHGRLGPKYTVDHAWVESVEQRFAVKREKLENELNGYREGLSMFMQLHGQINSMEEKTQKLSVRNNCGPSPFLFLLHFFQKLSSRCQMWFPVWKLRKEEERNPECKREERQTQSMRFKLFLSILDISSIVPRILPLKMAGASIVGGTLNVRRVRHRLELKLGSIAIFRSNWELRFASVW